MGGGVWVFYLIPKIVKKCAFGAKHDLKGGALSDNVRIQATFLKEWLLFHIFHIHILFLIVTLMESTALIYFRFCKTIHARDKCIALTK